MGHFVLLESLKGSLERAYGESGRKGRVVLTSSGGLKTAPTGGIVFESLKPDDKGVVGAELYKQPIYGQVSGREMNSTVQRMVKLIDWV